MPERQLSFFAEFTPTHKILEGRSITYLSKRTKQWVSVALTREVTARRGDINDTVNDLPKFELAERVLVHNFKHQRKWYLNPGRPFGANLQDTVRIGFRC